MFGNKLTEMRRSLGTSSIIQPHQTEGKIVSRRDTHQVNYQEYGLNVQLSDNKKKMLEAFKQSSVKFPQQERLQHSEILTAQSFVDKDKKRDLNKQEIQKLTKIEQKMEQEDPLQGNMKKTMTKQSLTLSVSKHPINLNSTLNFSNLPNSSYDQSDQDVDNFLREVFDTLGLSSENDLKLQMDYLISSAYSNYVQMKSNGRWKLIQTYFKGECSDNDAFHEPEKKSIIKKRSNVLGHDNSFEKKKVRVIDPETASQLEQQLEVLGNNLQNMLQKAINGFQLKRFSNQKLKVQQGTLFFSYDFRYLCWSQKNKTACVYSMSKFNGLADGIKSKNLKRYSKAKQTLNEKLILSILFTDTTLDLQANSLEEKQSFMFMIREIKSYC